MKYLIQKLDKFAHLTIYKNQHGAVHVEWRDGGPNVLPEDKIPAYTVQLVKQNMPLDTTIYGFLNEDNTKYIMYGCPKYCGVATPSTLILPRIESYAAQIGLPFIKYKTYADNADIDVLDYERILEGNAI